MIRRSSRTPGLAQRSSAASPARIVSEVRRSLLLGAVLLALASACAAPTSDAPSNDSATPPTVVFLVRHAEKVEDGSSDPALTEQGVARSAALAQLLADAKLDGIYSTDYVRTRETARPVAEATGLAVESYDPGDLEAFAATLRAKPGRYLVSGHSNTTPSLVELLGGDPGGAIDEATEYDRLYVVVIYPGRPATTALLRYGGS